MATFEISEDAELDSETVVELKNKFAGLEKDIEELEALEKSAIKYFDKLEAVGDKLEEAFGEYGGEDVILINDNEFYTHEYGGALTAAYSLDLWIPSSMGC